MAYLTATGIDLVGEGGIHLHWSDGHTSVYPYRWLRAQCTCAHCKHEWTGRRLVFEDQIDAGVFPVAVAPVGRYGLSFTWNDNHKAGIYTFDRLREICPCSECAAKAAPAAPSP